MKRTLGLAIAVAWCAVAPPAAAQPASTDPPTDEPSTDEATEPPDDPTKLQARDAYLEGIARAKKARWSEALAAFERSAKLRPLALTSYNVGACLRALGRYTLAKKAFERALTQNADAGSKELSDTVRQDTEAFIGEIDRLLARAQVTLDPPTAAISVDGRPLEPSSTTPPVLLAGTLPPGKGTPPPARAFDVRLNPGVHVFSIARKGYADAVVNESFEPGQTRRLDLTLSKLPATLRISSSEGRSIVNVDGRDVGQTPLELARLEGKYRVSVFKEGFVPYETTVSLDPGQMMNLRAELSLEEPALYEEWWFWTAIGAGITAAALTTYFLARPGPDQPQPDCGALSWCIAMGQ